jgi:hypothetical protein
MFWYLNLLPDYRILSLPIRIFCFIGFIGFIGTTKIKKNTLILPIVAIIYFILYYPLSYLSDRQFTASDIGLSATFLVLFFYANLTLSKPLAFVSFARVFFVINILYVLYQLVVIYSGFPWLSMVHQNSHAADYAIPFSNYPPYLPRYTGLFVESAPFTIYLAMSFFLFISTGFRSDRLLAIFAIALMILGGAKSSFVFLILIALYYLRVFKYLSSHFFILLTLAVVSFIYLSGDLIVEYLLSVDSNSLAMGSVIVRLTWFLGTIDSFLREPFVILFGGGFITTKDLLNEIIPQRGIDFFSYFVFSVGLVGFLLLYSVVSVVFNKEEIKYITVEERRFSFALVAFSLMVMGSVFNFQYIYFLCALLALNKMRLDL